MTIKFDPLDDSHGIRVRDTAEGEQFPLRTDCAVDPAPAATDGFTMPVDAAVAVEARELHIPVFSSAVFWQGGEAIERVDASGPAERLERGTYEVDFSPPSVKLYVRVEDAAPRCVYTDDHAYLDVGETTRVIVGVRSHHETPAGTVTVTDDPRDLMAGVSTFGSALKTLSPDRSWPTLRGHPPAIERGSVLDVPEAVTPPETDVRVEVPPAYGPIFTVAPLAFYLGASVEPGEQPRLVAGDAVREFDATALAADVQDVLEHVFTLDCVVREAGVYPFRTATGEELDDRVTLDYEAHFELPLAERTAAYLDVPRAATAGLLDWHYTAHVAPDAQYAPALPYLVDELAVVHSPPGDVRTLDQTPSPDSLGSASGPLARSAPASSSSTCSVVAPAAADTPGQTWIADGYAVRAANPTVGSFRRAFQWPDDDGGPLDVHVVYNDARLEASEQPAYDIHSYRETSVTTSQNLTTSQLRSVLQSDVDFLHFVGHVTDAGMVCPDGALDVRTLVNTGVSAFLLNGCRSYEQGRALLTAGAVGGIVTVDDVADATAGRVGETVGALLAAGSPLYAILDGLKRVGISPGRYSILGDGTFAVRRSQSGSANLLVVNTDAADADADAIPITTYHYPKGENGMGSVASYRHATAAPVVHSTSPRQMTIPRENLDEFLADSGIPVVLDGDLRFTDDLSAAEFR